MNKVVMYTQTVCGFCSAAKRLLQSKGVDIEEINVDRSPEMRQEVVARTGMRTVPQIFIGDKFVGGYQELQALEMAGELDALLTNQ